MAAQVIVKKTEKKEEDKNRLNLENNSLYLYLKLFYVFHSMLFLNLRKKCTSKQTKP